MKAKKLFVGNLTYNTTVSQLTELFSVYGDVEAANIVPGKGYGFVLMNAEDDADRARNALNGTMHEGNVLIVDFARSRS
jgi:RNA recognition motif-containing protein